MESEANKMEQKARMWKWQYISPKCQLVLWGWDEKNNPAFCIFYGLQTLKRFEKERRRNYTIYEKESLRENEVSYTVYEIYSGQKGHIPSFPKVSIYEGTQQIRIWDTWEKERGVKLQNPLIMPYYDELSYSEIVAEVKKQISEIPGFHIAESPNDILKLEDRYQAQFGKVCELFSNPNLYMRRKYLTELLKENLPKEFFVYFLTIGSTQAIAGLFLELAKQRNTMLLEETKEWKDKVDFAEKKVMEGVRRCADIYINALDSGKRQLREKKIRDALPEMDLHYQLSAAETEIYANMLDKEKGELSAEFYQKKKHLLMPHEGQWEQNKKGGWKYVEKLRPKYYKEGLYNDGRQWKVIPIKNTIQEAEAYKLPDVIGKIAYFMDAPRIVCYCTANAQSKVKFYFIRYLRRVIDSYADSDPDSYMKALSILLGSYTKGDYLSKYYGNFQKNYFIRYYLYHSLETSPPNYEEYAGIYYKYAQDLREYEKNDQMLLHDGRFELYPEIWDQHLEETAKLAISSELEVIAKACYFILKDNMEKGRLLDALSKNIIGELTNSFYQPLKALGEELLAEALKNTEEIEEELLLALLKSTEEKIWNIAVQYIENHDVTPELLASMLLIENTCWIPVWKRKFSELSGEKMLQLIENIYKQRGIFAEWNIEGVMDALEKKIIGVEAYSWQEKQKLFDFFVALLTSSEKLPKLLLKLIEAAILSIPREEIRKLANNLEQEKRVLRPENARMLTILTMLQTNEIPSSAKVLDIIEKGSNQMRHLLLEVLNENKLVLLERKEIFLMFAESPILLLNETAKQAMRGAKEEKKIEMLSVLIDSPVERAYHMGLNELEEQYQGKIPSEIIRKMIEHPSEKIKAYIAEKAEYIINELGCGDSELFLYYVRTLLYLPNKTSKSKELIYKKLSCFVRKYPVENNKVEEILYDIGGSNCKKDSEQALVALARIRNEVSQSEN